MPSWWAHFSRFTPPSSDSSRDWQSMLPQFFFGALLVTLTLNLFLKIPLESAYINGLLVDYLLPKITISDLVMVIFLCVLAIATLARSTEKTAQKRAAQDAKNITQTSLIIITGMLVVLLLMMQIMSVRPMLSLSLCLHFGLVIGAGTWLANAHALIHQQWLRRLLLCIMVFQLAVGGLQFSLQRSVTPDYRWLGETRLAQTAGIARGVFFSQEKILPYGTTAHPNIFAGVLSVFALTMLLLEKVETQRRTLWLPSLTTLGALLAAGFGSILAQSWSAMFTLVGGATIILLSCWWRKLPLWVMGGGAALVIILVPLAIEIGTSLSQEPSLERRAILSRAGWELWLQRPLTGSGLGTVTALIETTSARKEIVRFVQPPHHVGILILSEVGLAGISISTLIAVLWLSQLPRKKRMQLIRAALTTVWILLPLLTLDHYLWTNATGRLLVAVCGTLIVLTFMEMEKGVNLE